MAVMAKLRKAKTYLLWTGGIVVVPGIFYFAISHGTLCNDCAYRDESNYLYFLIAGSVASLLGYIELLTRFENKSSTAVRYWIAWAYHAIHFGMGAIAYYVVIEFEPEGLMVFQSDNPYLFAVSCGLANGILTRFKLFEMKSEDGKSQPFGFAMIIDNLLKAVEMRVDDCHLGAVQKEISETLGNSTLNEERWRKIQMLVKASPRFTDEQAEKVAKAILEHLADIRKGTTEISQIVATAIVAIVGLKNFKSVLNRV